MSNEKLKGMYCKLIGCDNIMGFKEVQIRNLLPYLDYCVKNGGIFDIRRMDRVEKKILKCFEAKKYIKISEGIISISSKDFYKLMQSILYETRVIRSKEEEEVNGSNEKK